MDAFYASIEQRDEPLYRGRPVIVGSDPREGRGRGVVAACSYEARRLGIHSAQPISLAWRKCPDGVYLRPNFAKYRDVSAAIHQIFLSFTPLVQPLSIDEAFLDLTERCPAPIEAVKMARALKHDIFREQRLTASVGIGPSKFVAKIASDLKKPNGLLLIRHTEVRKFLDPLPIKRIWGVGPRTEARLKEMGIETIQQLRLANRGRLLKRFGKAGGHLWRLANGIDERPVLVEQQTKSVSNEHTFPEDVLPAEVLVQQLKSLSEKLSRRLQKAGLRGKTVTLKLRYSDFTTLTRQRSFREPVSGAEEVFQEALHLFNSNRDPDRWVRLIGVRVSGFDQDDPQLRLF